MITFVSAIGAIISKFFAERVFALYGFRWVLAVGVGLGALFFAVNGFFTPATPIWLIMGALLVGGVIRSLTFTGVNALAYADVEEADMSQATSINAVIQRLAQAFGIAIAGAILEIAAHTHDGPVQLSDFHISFWLVGIMSALAMIPFLRLAPDAGAQVSGHVRYADPIKQAN
jgi:MFS family permease